MQSPVPPPGNSTKHTRVFDSGPFLALYVNMTSSTKPEVHNVSHCHQRRTKTRSHVTRINRPFCEIWTVIRADKQTNKQTNRQTDIAGRYITNFILGTCTHSRYRWGPNLEHAYWKEPMAFSYICQISPLSVYSLALVAINSKLYQFSNSTFGGGAIFRLKDWHSSENWNVKIHWTVVLNMASLYQI